MQNAYRWIKRIPPGFLIKYLNYITKFSVSLNVSFLILPGRATSVNHKYNCRVTVIYPFVKRKYLSHSAQAQNSFVFSKEDNTGGYYKITAVPLIKLSKVFHIVHILSRGPDIYFLFK
jgi:hypothetical protein